MANAWSNRKVVTMAMACIAAIIFLDTVVETRLFSPQATDKETMAALIQIQESLIAIDGRVEGRLAKIETAVLSQALARPAAAAAQGAASGRGGISSSNPVPAKTFLPGAGDVPVLPCSAGAAADAKCSADKPW